MKYFLILMFLGSLGEAYYLRGHLPAQWNRGIELLKVPEPSAEALSPAQREINAEADKVVASAVSVAANLQATVVAPAKASSVPKVFVAPNPLPARPDWTWTTADGKTYKNVVITKVEADCVTILDSDGGGRVDIAQLPVDVQQLLNYDPALGANAETQRSQNDQANQAAIDQEAAAAKQAKLKTDTETDANVAKIQADGRAADDAVSADLRVQNAKSDMADLQTDLDAVTKHVYFINGKVSGEAVYVEKYDDDKAAIASCQAIIDGGGK